MKNIYYYNNETIFVKGLQNSKKSATRSEHCPYMAAYGVERKCNLLGSGYLDLFRFTFSCFWNASFVILKKKKWKSYDRYMYH